MTMALPHPIPDALAELIGYRLRVIGEPMRIKLLDRLLDGELSVRELTEALDASQQNVSRHLGASIRPESSLDTNAGSTSATRSSTRRRSSCWSELRSASHASSTSSPT